MVDFDVYLTTNRGQIKDPINLLFVGDSRASRVADYLIPIPLARVVFGDSAIPGREPKLRHGLGGLVLARLRSRVGLP